jgi:nuclear pore complex protein Nup85
MPVDPTSIEEMLHAALFKANFVQAASLANDVDIWLVAHMTDMLQVIPTPEADVIA